MIAYSVWQLVALPQWKKKSYSLFRKNIKLLLVSTVRILIISIFMLVHSWKKIYHEGELESMH